MRLLAPDADAHLGGAARLGQAGPATVDAMDAEVRRTVEAAAADAEDLVNAHRAVLDALTDALVDAEHVEGRALAELLAPVLPGEPGGAPARRRTVAAR